MLNVLKYEAKTKEEALENALQELQLKKEDLFLKSEFVEGKLFKSSKYIVSVLPKSEIKDYIANFIKEISNSMNFKIECEILEKDEIFNVTLVSDNNAILIGKEGRTLNAIQTLIRQSVKNKIRLGLKLNIDVANYKLNKLKNIERLVRGIAEDVEASQISVSLDPMNSYERRLVHTIVNEYPLLETESVGEGKERHVTIKYKEI